MNDIDKYMMELPLDADDVPIRVGDTMRCTMGDYEYEVLGVGEQCFFAWNTDGGRLAQIDARNFTHRKRTLEDVLEDYLADAFDAQAMFVAESMGYDEYDSTLEELVKKTAEEIRSGKWIIGY